MHRFLLRLSVILVLSGCSLMASDRRIINPDEEFAKLDSPNVPGVDQTLLKSAKESEESGDYLRAGVLYQQLYAKTPANIDYQYGLAENLRRTGQFDKAIKLYEILSDGENKAREIESLEGKGLSLMGKGEFAEAGKVFARVMEKDATRWRTLNALGILFALKQLHDEAFAYYEEALRFSPNNLAVINNIGLTRAMNKEYDMAIQALEKGSRLASGKGAKQRHIDLNLALIYGISGDMDRAESVAGRYLEGPALQNNLGLYAHLAKNEQLAKSYLNMALSNNPYFYKRAWENLDMINQASSGTQPVQPQGRRIKIGK